MWCNWQYYMMMAWMKQTAIFWALNLFLQFAEPWQSIGSSPPQEKKLVNKHLIGSTRWSYCFPITRRHINTDIQCTCTGNFQATTFYKLEVPHTWPEGDLSVSLNIVSTFILLRIQNIVSTFILLLIQVGTLDQLVGLSDDLGKLDVFVEQVTRLLAVQWKFTETQYIWWSWQQIRKTGQS